MNIFSNFGLILVSSLSILVVQASAQDLLKVYPYHGVLGYVCGSTSDSYNLTKFTEEEIWEKCKNHKYAEITEICKNGRGKVSCCDVISDGNTATNFVHISTKPNFEKLCSQSPWTGATFGAFTDRSNLTLYTLYINDRYTDGQK